MKTKTCLLVLGMHRSGTSAFTRLLNLVGAEMPKTPLQSTNGNETGHWESEKLVQYNDKFLHELNSHWDDWQPLELELLRKRKHENFIEDVSALIKYEYNDAPLIAIKDPRTCRFANLYAEAIKAAGYDVKVINVIRNPLEVNASLAKRNAMPSINSGLLWLRHVLDAEFQSRNHDRGFVTFDGFLNDPTECLQRLATDLNIEWPYEPKLIEDKINAFLGSNHKHHNRSTEDVLLDPILRTWVGETYETLRRVQTCGFGASDLKTLDTIRKNFNAASPLLQSLTDAHKAKLTHAIDYVDALNKAIKDKNSHETNLKEHIKNLSAERDHLGKDITEINKAIEYKKSHETDLHNHIKSLTAERDHLGNDIITLNQTIKDKDKDNTELSSKLTQHQTSINALKSKYKNVKNKLIQTDKKAGQLSKSLEQKKCELIEAHANTKVLAKKIEEFTEKENTQASHIWELGQQLENESAHNKFKQTKLDDILNSTSWKLTALPRKLIRGWRRKTLIIVGLLAGKTVREKLKASDNIGEMAAHARSKATLTARRHLAKNRHKALKEDWFKAEYGLKVCKNGNLPNITISAVTYNSEKWMSGFFAAIEALDYPHPKISIHFVDNGSSDNTVSLIEGFIEKKSPGFNNLHIFQRPNEGYGAGNDYGIRQSKDEFVLVTNVDTEFYTNSLRNVVNVAIHDDPKTACWEYRQTPYEHPKYYDPVTHLTNWTSHACVLIRRSAYLAVGGYEKRIFMYGEDVELSYRFRAYGWNLRYVPTAVIKHYVDLEDTTLRPNQLSGSAAANILLRYRYGSYIDILAGEAFFKAVKRNETDLTRMAAWDEATRIIKAHRGHFFRKRKFKKEAYFPFHEFDYDVIRPGANVAHIPYKADEETDLPLISIITRTHGKAQHHLQNAIASVLSQTYKNIELIIVEDRTDEAREYVENLSALYGNKIRYYKSTSDGRSACGNHGAQQAKGKFLCWLDNDDMFFADHIETLVRALEQDPNAVCSYSLAWDALSKIDNQDPVELSYELPELHCRPYDKERFLAENFIPIQAIIFSKDLFDTYGGFNVEYSQLEDWNLWARYAQVGPFIYTPKVTSLYRTPENKEERHTRHMALHAVYEDVRRATLKDIAALNVKSQLHIK